nr:MAG: Nucleoside 2-deoxyribosyltransferase like protein [Bacteriophage sp.]
MRVYIAGAMTGRFDYKKYFNEAEEFVRSKGHIVLNPSFLPEGLVDYYKINKAMIDQCDAIYVLLHSENSVGTKKEIEYAKSTCKQVIYQQEEKQRKKSGAGKKILIFIHALFIAL